MSLVTCTSLRTLALPTGGMATVVPPAAAPGLSLGSCSEEPEDFAPVPAAHSADEETRRQFPACCQRGHRAFRNPEPLGEERPVDQPLPVSFPEAKRDRP